MRSFIASLFRLSPTPSDRGVGTRNIAVGLTAHPVYSMYGPRYNVQKNLSPTSRGYLYATQSAPIVSIEGNGSDIAGQYAMQSLSSAKVNG